MTDQVEKYSTNCTPALENAFSLNAVKKEKCQEDDLADDKLDISDTAIIKDSTVLLHQLFDHKMNQHDISITWDNIKTEQSCSEEQHESPKIEGGIGEIRIEFNNGLLYCEDCQVYYEDYCALCGMLVRILNRTAPINDENRSLEELPGDDILEIQDYFGQSHVLALKVIPAGVKFGPFVGLNKTEYPWKIKGGKFVVTNDKSKSLNWMQYINPARNVSEQNLFVFQYGHNLYYQSTCEIQMGDELLVYFGEEYEDSLNRNVEMDFVPTTEHNFKYAFACTYCCLGFSSKLYLAKHKTFCPENVNGEFSIEELMQCPSCKIHLDRKEYMRSHVTYCCERYDRKCISPTLDFRAEEAKGRKTRPRLFYRCQQCRYRTKYKGDLRNHTNHHYQVKMNKCGICYRRFKTKAVLRLHVETIHIRADTKEDSERYMNAHVKIERTSSPPDKTEPFKCALCEFRTKRKVSLKTHLNSKHFKEFRYKCDQCDYRTNRKNHLERHGAIHTEEFKYKCDVCDYKTKWKYTFEKHMERRHLKNFKYCNVCDYKSTCKFLLKIHIKTRHLKEFRYKCEQCDYKTNWTNQIKAHIETKHLQEFKYKCDTCDYKTHQKCRLTRHIESRHLREYKYKCDACDYKAISKVYLKVHTDRNHLKVFKYKCDTCDYKTNRKYELKTHVQVKHTNEVRYKCGTCNFKTNWKQNLKNHVEARHLRQVKDRRVHQCASCDYKTISKSTLSRHIDRKHLKVCKYKCDICGYKTDKRNVLETHIEARHTNEFKYMCDKCDYKAHQKGSLKAHIERIHLKVFKYKCDSCDYKTSQKNHLERHIEARHLREFKYKCEICDYRALRQSQIKIHVDTKHLKVFKYKCDMCKYKTNHKNHLKRHVEGQH